MQLNDSIDLLTGWLYAAADARAPENLAEAVWTVAGSVLAHRVGAFRDANQAARERIAEECVAFIRTERERMNGEDRAEITEALLVAVQDRRQVDTGKWSLDALYEELSRRLARGLFGASFRPEAGVGRGTDLSWGRLLDFTVSEYLVGEALRLGERRFGFPGLDGRLSRDGLLPPEDRATDFVEQVLRRSSLTYCGVAPTIDYFLTKVAREWTKRVEDPPRLTPLSDDLDFETDPEPQDWPADVPSDWNECRERFAPRVGDAGRLLFLRQLRGPFRGPLEPADVSWQQVAEAIEGRAAHQDRFRKVCAEEDLATLFDGRGNLSPERDALLLETAAAVEHCGCAEAGWPVALLAGYYFLALLPPDVAFRPYPARRAEPLTDTGAWLWLVEFLRENYHLPRTDTPLEQQGWSAVLGWLRSVDGLIAAHRVIRITRLPPGVCWHRLDRLAAARKLSEDSVKQFYSRYRADNQRRDRT